MVFDTNLNAPESYETLIIQQKRLTDGKRSVQMFPAGTKELPLPTGMRRVGNSRGCFHYNPAEIDAGKILELSASGRENEFLELGPYSKADILFRMMAGEKFTAISEQTADGIEVRTAAATEKTLPVQTDYFNKTKDDENTIVVGLPNRARLMG